MARKYRRLLSGGIAATLGVALVATGATLAFADDSDASLKLWYPMTSGSGTTIADASGNGKDATLVGGASWGGGGLRLDGTGYVHMPNDLIAGIEDVTVSIDVLIDPGMSGNYFIYNFGNPAVGTPQSGAGYLFATGDSKVRGAISNVAWGAEQSVSGPTALARGVWKTVSYTLSAATAKLYVDGELVATNPAVNHTPAGINNGKTTSNFIGKSAYAADVLLKGRVKDFRLYDRALGATEVADISAANAKLTLDADIGALDLGDTTAVRAPLALPRTGAGGSTIAWASSDETVVAADGSIGTLVAGDPDRSATLTATATLRGQSLTRDFEVTVTAAPTDLEKAEAAAGGLVVHQLDDVRGNITLPTTGLSGATVTWASSNSAVVGLDGIVQRPTYGSADQDVALTATVTVGTASATRSFDAKVRAMPEAAEYEAYMFSYFTANSLAGEKIYFAASEGNDALTWNELNKGAPVLESTEGTNGLRDPFLIRSPEGDKFYLIATDLSIGGGTSWDESQRRGSQYLEVWESTDLVNWSAQRHVKVAPDNAGNTWAPEAYYDETIGAYVVFWASKLYDASDPGHAGSVHNRMLYATTRDFQTFTEPQVWQDPGKSVIDSTVLQDGDTYYRFTKDEGSASGCTDILAEKSTDLRAFSPSTDWVRTADCIGKNAGTSAVEGPTVFQANPNDVNGPGYYLFVDEYGNRGYVPLRADSLDSAKWTMPTSYSLPSSPRHGTVMPITAAEHERVMEVYAPDLVVTSIEPVSALTQTGDAPILPATVTAQFADRSERSVAVAWDAIDPADYATAGTFTVAGTIEVATSMRAEATVTVTDNVIEVTNLTVSPPTLTVAVGAVRALTAEVTPSNATGRTITWKSDDPSIASVSNAGVVTANAIGTATITASTASGTHHASSAVTVTDSISGQVLNYPLTGSGTTAVDLSPTGRDGSVLGGAQLGAEGLSLDGTNDYVKVPNDIMADLDSITVALDVKIDPSQGTPYFIYGLGNSSGSNGDGYLFTTGNHYRTSIASGNWATEQTTRKSSSYNLDRGVWKHLTYTQTGTVGVLYEDGVEIGRNSAVTTTPGSIGGGTTTANYVGRSVYSGDKYLKGTVRDFQIYDRALTGDEVAVLAQDGLNEAVTADLDSLDLGDTSAVIADLGLPTLGEFGSAITWTSSSPDVVSAKGIVTRPEPGAGNATAILTATVTKGSASKDRQFTVTVVEKLDAFQAAKWDAEHVVIPNLDDVRGAITLPGTGEFGSTLTWASSNPAAITPTGEVTRPPNGSAPTIVDLTATATNGSAKATHSYRATVVPAPVVEDLEAYMFAYFTGESTASGESIYFAASDGNTALDWNELNDGLAVLKSDLGEKGLRDPFIIRSHEGDRFFLIATDLQIYGGGNFGLAQERGSKHLMIWESTDLVNWGEQRMVKVSGDFAGNTWAPEAYFNDATGEYVVYWASNLYDTVELDGRKASESYNRMMYVTTRDFVTFSEPQIWMDEKRGDGKGYIDSTVIKEGDTYYRYTKDERVMKVFGEKSTDLLADDWTPISSEIGGDVITHGEGPSIFKSNTEEKWYLFQDWPPYGGGSGYVPFETTDLNSGVWTKSTGANLPTSPRHGTVLPLSQREWNTLVAGFTDDTEAPVLTVTTDPSGPDGSNNWFTTSPVTASASAIDAGDPNPTVGISTDGQTTWSQYTAPEQYGEGVTELAFRASDESGNVSAIQVVRLLVDATVPVLTVSTDADLRQVSAVGTDAGSGLDRVEYRLGTDTWVTYAGAVTVGDDAVTLTWRAFDMAGNISAEQVVDLPAKSVDPTDPPTTEPPGPTDPPTTEPPGPTDPPTTAPPGPSESGPRVSVTPGTVTAGGKVTVTVTGLTANTPVQVWLHSVPTLLATQVTGPDGALTTTVTIPATTKPGVHNIRVVDTATGQAIWSDGFEVQAAGGLPVTGAALVPLMVLALALVAGGVVIRHRRLAVQ